MDMRMSNNIRPQPGEPETDAIGGVHIYDVYVAEARTKISIAVACFSRGCSER